MNPYQDIIDWLESPDGESWSQDKHCGFEHTVFAQERVGCSTIAYQEHNLVLCEPGLFTAKPTNDTCTAHCEMYRHGDSTIKFSECAQVNGEGLYQRTANHFLKRGNTPIGSYWGQDERTGQPRIVPVWAGEDSSLIDHELDAA